MADLQHKLRSACSLVRDFTPSLYGGWRDRVRYRDIESFCLFIGYPRSGHSLVGSLLDAHPEIVISQELHALRYIAGHYTRLQLYYLILCNSQRFTEQGRVWSGYSYVVPGQWQGRWRSLRIIGDKKGGGTTLSLRTDPGLLARLRQTVGVPVKVIHVVRNPFDNISTMLRRARQQNKLETLETSAQSYFSLCQTVAATQRRVASADWCELRHEELLADGAGSLRRLATFLGCAAPEDWVQACTGVLFTSPHVSRYETSWSRDEIARVAQSMEEFPFLAGYTF